MNNINRFSKILSYQSKIVFTIAKITVIILVVFTLWFLKDINSILYSTKDPNNPGDLSWYYNFYNDYSENNINDFKRDVGFIWLIIVLKKIGFSFKFFLFICLFLYYLIISIVFYKITFFKNSFIYFILIVMGSFFLVPLFLVAFRQGIAFLILIFFFFGISSTSFILRLFIVILASSIHLTAIIFLPFVIFEKLIKRGGGIKLIDNIFIATFLLYVMGFSKYTSNLFIYFLSYFDLEMRAFEVENEYKVGFSVYKAIAIVIPALLFRLTNFSNKYFGFRIYTFFSFTCVIGMFLSYLPYHDRIFLYGWGVSSILIACFINSFLKNILSISKKSY